MVRQQMNAPVSLMLIVIGVALVYFVLHSHGWNLSGQPTLSDAFRSLSIAMRALVVAGIVAAGWGTGALLNSMVRQQ